MHPSVACHRFLIAKTIIDPRAVHVIFIIREEDLVRGFLQVLPFYRVVYFSILTFQSAVPHRQSPPTEMFKHQYYVQYRYAQNKNFVYLPQNVFMPFVWLPKQTAVFSCTLCSSQ
jgi:hypothetical protein